MKKTFFLLATISLMVACGNNSKKEETPQTEVKTETPVLNQDSSSKTDEINVTINGTDQMTFDVKEIRVKPGQRVNVTLHHSGSLPKTAMGHNFVLLKKMVPKHDCCIVLIFYQCVIIYKSSCSIFKITFYFSTLLN